MIKIKVSELAGPALNYLVAKCEGFGPDTYMNNIDIRFDVHGKCSCLLVPIDRTYVQWNPSTDWAQGGPIIDRHPRCAPQHDERFYSWFAYGQSPAMYGKQSFLEAAMRCYVASKLGDFVEVPEELLNVD